MIAEGTDLSEICRSKWMPTRKMLVTWMMRGHVEPDGPYGEFVRRFGFARELAAEFLVEELQRIADRAGDEDGDTLAQAKLKIDALKWRIGRMLRPRSGREPPPAPRAITHEEALELLD